MVRCSVLMPLLFAAASTVSADGLAVAYGVWLCDNKDPDLNTLPVEFRYSYPRGESSDWTSRTPVSEQGWNLGKLQYWTAGWRFPEDDSSAVVFNFDKDRPDAVNGTYASENLILMRYNWGVNLDFCGIARSSPVLSGKNIVKRDVWDDGDFNLQVPILPTLINAANKCPNDATVKINVVDAQGKAYVLEGPNEASLEVPANAALPLRIEVSDGEFGSAGAVIGEVPVTYATGGGPRVPPFIGGWNTLSVDFCPPDDGD